MTDSNKLFSNIKDTALIFEGGGMRASFTAGLVSALLEEGIYFDYVAGISAGSSHAVNYLSRDNYRVHCSFVHFALDRHFGSLGTFIRGKGFFDSEYIYGQAGNPGSTLPFDMETFLANPARIRIGAFDRDRGQMKYWGREDMPTLDKVMLCVRASSSLPITMPETVIDGVTYVDGGLGESVPLSIARQDGLRRFVLVLTRPEGYRKPELSGRQIRLYQRLLGQHPRELEALLSRTERYNQQRAEIEAMEKRGEALVFYADGISVNSYTRDINRLEANYGEGYRQARAKLPDLRAFVR